jgi:hypothetical protein
MHAARAKSMSSSSSPRRDNDIIVLKPEPVVEEEEAGDDITDRETEFLEELRSIGFEPEDRTERDEVLGKFRELAEAGIKKKTKREQRSMFTYC